MSSAGDALNAIKESKAKFVDFRFTDTHGKEHHVSVPASTVDEDTFEEGKMVDGSSIAGWKNIDNSTNSELELIFSIITFEIWLKKFKIIF